MSNFYTWFQEPLIFWLRAFENETFERVHRALDMDKDVVLVHQVVKFSNSAVDVQACFAKVGKQGYYGFVSQTCSENEVMSDLPHRGLHVKKKTLFGHI